MVCTSCKEIKRFRNNVKICRVCSAKAVLRRTYLPQKQELQLVLTQIVDEKMSLAELEEESETRQVQSDNLLLRIAETKHELQALQRPLDEAAFSDIAPLTAENAHLAVRLKDRERQLAARTEELDSLREEVAALDAETKDRKRYLDAVSKKLRQTMCMENSLRGTMQLRATISRLEAKDKHSDQDSDDIDKAFNYVPEGSEQRQYVSEYTDPTRVTRASTSKMIESTMDHGSSLRQTTTE